MDIDAFTRPISSASLASLSSSSSTTDETDELKDAPQPKQQQPRITVQGSEVFTTNVFPASPGKDWNQDVADAYEQEQELDRSFMEDDDEYVTAPFDIPYEPPPPRADIFPTYYEEDSPELYYHPDTSIEVDVETFQDEDQNVLTPPPTSHLLTHVAFLARQNEFLRAELSHARENIHAMRRVVETMDMERIAEREKLVERAEQERMKRNEWIADIFKNGMVCQKCSMTDGKTRLRCVSAEGRERERSLSGDGKPIERPQLHDMSPYHSPLQSKSSQEYVAGWAAELALMEENSKERSRNYDDYDTPAVPYNSDAEEIYEDDDGISDLDLASDAASPMPKEGGLARMLWLTANRDRDSDSNSSDDDEQEHVFNFTSTKSCDDARICLTPCPDGDQDEDVVIFPKKVFSFSTWGGEGDEIYAGSSDDDADASIMDESLTDHHRIDEEELEVY